MPDRGRGLMDSKAPGMRVPCRGGGGGRLLLDYPEGHQESAEPRLPASSCEPPNPQRPCLLGTPPPLWGSWEAALKVCLTFSPPLDLLSTEPRQLVGRL